MLESVRSQPALRRLAVVVLTSSQEPRDVNRAYDLSANSYLAKPVDATQLATLLGLVFRSWVDTNELPELAQ